MPFLQSVAQRFIGSTVRYPMKEIMFLILCVAGYLGESVETIRIR